MAAPEGKTPSDSDDKKFKANSDGKVKLIRNATELQRLKLEKLMKNPTKEVIIPDKSTEKSPRGPLEFIRNIWGSSAGAGSGDFHVYRGIRRREYARQKFMNEKAKKDALDQNFVTKLEENKTEAEKRTAKKRAKRLKKKEKLKAKRMKKKDTDGTKEKESSSESESEEEEEEKSQ